jgi:1-deoxy-D-xylulose-5-phosphate reductoisomerase
LERLDITRLGSLDFLPLDTGRYPCFTVALEAAKAGGTYPATLCGADDVAVGLFLAGRLGFMDIPTLIQRVLDEHTSGNGDSVEDILAAESWARRRAQELAMVNI